MFKDLGKYHRPDLQDPLWAKCAGFLIAQWLKFLFLTARKRFIDQENLRQFLESGERVIVASWHNRSAFSPFAYLSAAIKGRKVAPIASASKDGALAAWILAFLGLNCVRGSSSRGGKLALKQMLGLFEQGTDLGFTPDGPRGPLYHVEMGVIKAAKESGAPIVPVSYQAQRRTELNSWDRFIIPKPFSKVNFTYGKPLYVPRDIKKEQMQDFADQLKAEMLRIGDVASQF